MSFAQSEQLADDNYLNLLHVLGGWKNELTEIIGSTQKSMEEVKKEFGKVQKALSEEMTELRGALDKEKGGTKTRK